MFRKTYVSAKIEIDEFMRSASYRSEVSKGQD